MDSPIEFTKQFIGEKLKGVEESLSLRKQYTEKELDQLFVSPGISYRTLIHQLNIELEYWQDLYKHFI